MDDVTKTVVSATDDEIIELLQKYADDVMVWLKKQMLTDDLQGLYKTLPGIGYVASRRLITTTREDPVLGKLYAFSEWGYPARLLGIDLAKLTRLHCIALFVNGDRSFRVDMFAPALVDLITDDNFKPTESQLAQIKDVTISTKNPWYFENEYDREMVFKRPAPTIKLGIFGNKDKDRQDTKKDPEKRSLLKTLLDFIFRSKL